MLEVKWKVKGINSLNNPSFRFNPCYVGSKMESLNPHITKPSCICFNPCYVGSKMERPFKVNQEVGILCFNPCYVGSKMERIILTTL